MHSTSQIHNFINSDGVRRAVDVCGALVALVIFSPILVGCSIALRLSGVRSTIFRQQRVGQNGRMFKVLKLTTMRDDAHLNGPLVSSAEDSRVTTIGKLLRRLNFNELPQFVNVIRGDMSLVGPRPETPGYAAKWGEEVRNKIVSVRPGVTGLSKLDFWNEAAILNNKDDIERAYIEEILPQKLRTELWYINHRTLWLDLRIVLITLLRFVGLTRVFNFTLGVPKIQSQEEIT